MKKYLLFAAATLLLAACSNESYILPDDDRTEIRLSSGIKVQTRTTHNLDMQLKAGKQVHVWVDDAGNENLRYRNRELTADGYGALTGDAMFFPQTGNAVNIYAIHGNFVSHDWTSDFWNQSVTHTVATNQQTGQDADGYALSNLVYAKAPDVARTEDAVNLSFTHLLFKVEVVLVSGNGNPDIEKVEILNTQLGATFTPNKENDFSVTASGTITDDNPILIDYGTTPSDIASQTDSDAGKRLNEAIIVPQTLETGTAFIRITTAEGGVLVYNLSEETEFEPAKKYRYTITANLTDLEVMSSIDNWGAGNSYSGDAEME